MEKRCDERFTDFDQEGGILKKEVVQQGKRLNIKIRKEENLRRRKQDLRKEELLQRLIISRKVYNS